MTPNFPRIMAALKFPSFYACSEKKGDEKALSCEWDNRSTNTLATAKSLRCKHSPSTL